MPAPPFQISLPPGFEVTEEPDRLGLGRSPLYAALVRDDRGREGVWLGRESRPGAVRTMIVYSQEAPGLSEFLYSRFRSA
jgi:hypothetical protein